MSEVRRECSAVMRPSATATGRNCGHGISVCRHASVVPTVAAMSKTNALRGRRRTSTQPASASTVAAAISA